MAEADDLLTMQARILEAAQRRGLVIEMLGEVGGDPLLLLRPATSSGPRLLIAAGFHGDEPGGCLGIAEFLEAAPDALFATRSLSFLPLVNPTGLRHRRHENDWGENPNRGFWHTKSGLPEVSREGAILVAHQARLLALSADGFLTLHEDIEQTRFYTYTFEQAAAPGRFSTRFIDIGRRFFDIVPDGPLEGGTAKDGLLFHFCEGSYEDALFFLGVPRTACTETPGLSPLALRVAANRALIEGLCESV